MKRILPLLLAADREGNICVPDQKVHRVQKLDPHGKLISAIAGSGENVLFSDGPGGVEVDAAGNLYSPDGLSMVRFSAGGKLLARWR